MNAWNKYHPRIYWDLHQDATPFTCSAATTTQAEIDARKVKTLLSAIQSELGISNKWIFSVSGGGGGETAYGGAAALGIASFMTEIMSGWDNSAAKKNSLDSGDTFEQIKAMFIAICTTID